MDGLNSRSRSNIQQSGPVEPNKSNGSISLSPRNKKKTGKSKLILVGVVSITVLYAFVMAGMAKSKTLPGDKLNGKKVLLNAFKNEKIQQDQINHRQDLEYALQDAKSWPSGGINDGSAVSEDDLQEFQSMESNRDYDNEEAEEETQEEEPEEETDEDEFAKPVDNTETEDERTVTSPLEEEETEEESMTYHESLQNKRKRLVDNIKKGISRPRQKQENSMELVGDFHEQTIERFHLAGQKPRNQVADKYFHDELSKKKLRTRLEDDREGLDGAKAKQVEALLSHNTKQNEDKSSKIIPKDDKKTHKRVDKLESSLKEKWLIPSTFPHGFKLYDKTVNGSASMTPLATPKSKDQAPDFTLIIQTSKERFYMLSHHCQRWEGPIVFVLYLIGDLSPPELPQECARRATVVVYRGYNDQSYPVNQLRNIGIQEVKTSHFFVCDVDFLTDFTLYRRLRAIGWRAKSNFEKAKLAFVVPAFSYGRYCYSESECENKAQRCPGDLEELHNCFEDKNCHIFDHRNPQGHSTTGYHEWHRQNSNQLRKIPCFKSNRYEPYMIIKKTSQTPLYDERFHGYGKNKIQYVAHVRYLGWQFYVIPSSYIIHAPHPKSESKKKWKEGSHREDMDRLYAQFLYSLDHLGATHMKTHKCSTKDVKKKKKK